MQLDPEVIFDAASRLSDVDRLTLAARLLNSVSNDSGGLSLDDPELIAELSARSADKDSGISWERLRGDL